MLFKKLIIFDFKSKMAKIVPFNEGINIITSSENQVGKSTIIKSLYYCLGGEVFFSNRLDINNKIVFLEVEIENNVFVFIRQSSYIVVKTNDNLFKFNSATQLAEFLSGILGFKVMLESKGGEFITAPPVFFYLPYYIDQDYGWTPELISFNKLKQFNKLQMKFYSYYHFGVLNKDFGEGRSEKKKIEKEIKKISTNFENVSKLLEFIENDLSSYNQDLNVDLLKLQYENALSDYKKYSYNLNNVRRELISINEEIYKIDKVIESITQSQKDHEKVIKNVKKQFEVECPNCESTFEVQAKDIFRINYNISDLDASKIELLNMKNKLNDRNIKVKKEFDELNEILIKIEKNKVTSELSFEQILKFKGLQETQQQLNKDYIYQDNEIKKKRKELKKVNEQLRVWNDKIKDTNSSYREKLNANLILFNTDENELPDIIEIDHNFTASGSGQVRVNLARVYSLLQLKEEMDDDHIRLPLVIDSPKGGEQSVTNSELILTLLTEKMEIPNQIILATIDFNSFYKGDLSSFNLIEIKNPKYSLLNEEEYQKNKKMIDGYFNMYWEACK